MVTKILIAALGIAIGSGATVAVLDHVNHSHVEQEVSYED